MGDEKSATATQTPTYVLVTPAHNEAELIGQTIESVVAQVLRPKKWVIVSDGSTDGTDEIVSRYAEQHKWIQLVRMPVREKRHFAGKVIAFNAGYDQLKDLEFEVIGSLDADITFDEEYFEFLMSKFADDEELGVAGTPFREGEEVRYNFKITSTEHVSGACQMFRRKCFEGIGGYVPVKEGGIDLVAVTTARMRGWKTRTFIEKTSEHHRLMGSANHRPLMAGFKSGYHDYLMGVHPLWQFSRAFYQTFRKPFLLGAVSVLAGFIWGMLRRPARPVTDEFVAFRRSEQMKRLRAYVGKTLPTRRSSAGAALVA